MRFYRVDMPEVPEGPVMIVAREGDPYAWTPNTGLWHWEEILVRDVYQESFRLSPITAQEALTLRQAMPRLDRRNDLVVERLEEFEQAPAWQTMSDAQVGLFVQPGQRPLSGEGVRTWLGKLRVGDAVPVALYRADQEHAARALASQVRSGRRRALEGADWDGTVVPARSGLMVVITKTADHPRLTAP